MSFINRVRQDLMAQANNLLDKSEKAQTIPVVKQKIRDLEAGLDKTRHEAAVAKANVTGLNRQKLELQHRIDQELAAAKSYLHQTPPNETAAKSVAINIHNHQEELKHFDEQIQAATTHSQQFDAVVEKLEAAHTQELSKLHSMQSTINMTQGMKQSMATLKSADELLTPDSSVDSLADDAQREADVANEEFNRTVATMQHPVDPVQDAAADDILASLRAS
jgi:phage shock protein A